jgi:hypothetical protein
MTPEPNARSPKREQAARAYGIATEAGTVRFAAWRLFFTATKGEDLLAAIHIDGDREMGSAVTKALAVMA